MKTTTIINRLNKLTADWTERAFALFPSFALARASTWSGCVWKRKKGVSTSTLNGRTAAPPALASLSVFPVLNQRPQGGPGAVLEPVQKTY